MTTVSDSIQPVIAAFLETTARPHAVALRFGECRLRVESNSKALIDSLTAYYREFLGDEAAVDVSITAIEALPPETGLSFTVKPRDPRKSKIKEEYVSFIDGRMVRKRLTTMLFCFTETTHLAIGPCLDNDNQVVNFINSRYIQWLLHRGGLLCHAAGVSRNGRGIGLAGFSGMGKSTLSLRLLSHGLDFISNDRTIVRRDGDALAMLGIPKLPRVNPGTIVSNPALVSMMSPADHARFSALDVAALWDLEQKYDVHLDRCYGPSRFHLETQLVGQVILNWERRDLAPIARRVDLAERPELLDALTKETGLFYLPRDGEVQAIDNQRYIDTLGDCPVLELSGGVNFEWAIEQCLSLLG